MTGPNYMVIVYYNDYVAHVQRSTFGTQFFESLEDPFYSKYIEYIYEWLGVNKDIETPHINKAEFFRRCSDSFILYDVMTRDREEISLHDG